MQVGTERSIFHASQFAEGLVKELDCPSLWFVLGPKKGSNLGPKEGSNGHEGLRGTLRTTWTQLEL